MTRELTAFLAPHGYLPQMQAELKRIVAKYDRLIVTEGPVQTSYWAQNVWYDARILPIKSIGDAASQLTQLQRNWWPFSYQLHRRMELIRGKLPHVAAKPLNFPESRPTSPLGSFTLIDPSTLLAAARCSSPFPNGEPSFVEYKEGPPSRAYLKLFETFTRLGFMPSPGEQCLELGASPGGWTWVLARVGAKVLGYDRAELDPNVSAMPGVTFAKGDAFGARPDRVQEKVGKVDWLFSDVICYPEKLFEFVSLWLTSGACENFVCTLKFQGEGHYDSIEKFMSIPGSRLMHLHNNKHELTWVRLGPQKTLEAQV
jgi:23S rRNA (cytidine2498-2'-O)-methyltransferase